MSVIYFDLLLQSQLTCSNDFSDLDADSQNEAPNAVMSGLESESESDPAEPAQDDVVDQQCVETSYVPFTEEEFGEVG